MLQAGCGFVFGMYRHCLSNRVSIWGFEYFEFEIKYVEHFLSFVLADFAGSIGRCSS